MRWGAAGALRSNFQYVSDKDEAWEDLIRMTQDDNRVVRLLVADALGSNFQYVSDKDVAWKDLIRLTQDKDSSVCWRAADALGSAFPYVSDKDGAWKDLIRLTGDENSNVRVSANHSLGRASIFKATVAGSEGDFESELNNAIDFFERSSKEATDFNPSRFCLPFYRSFCKLTFEKAGAEGEVHRYLAEAKSVSEGSENKETLLEAVENLANALSEAHKITDFDTKKSELNSYRRYCDRAADLISAAEDGAPSTAQVLRRGGLIINAQIKEIIREIQEKAEAVCRETRGTGTPYEPLGMEVNKWAGELSDRDYLRNEKNVSRIINILGEFCDLLPEDKRKYPCKIVEEIREESELEDKLSSIATAFSYLQPCIESQLQNAAKPVTDERRSDEQPSQKTGHSTTVIAESGSKVIVTQTETENGDVTVTHDAKAIEELQPAEHRIDHRKKIAIEIIAAFAVSVLVAILSPRYLEDLTPTASTVIAFIAFIILLVIILTQNRDRPS
ncbi:MAG: hypothetical protein C5S49_04310 [Candidatus Methanogaster sp.]|nr:MAG: hypothetical protein C5S49_04310 [ANME-2 cluster archaeon]